MKTTGVILTAIAILASAPALPNSLPAAGENTNCFYTSSGGVVIGTSTCSAIGSDANITLSPFAGSEADAAGGDGVEASSLAQLNYEFEVIGGTIGAEVPLIITADLTTSATTEATAEAILDVGGYEGSTFISQAACINVSVCTSAADFFGSFTPTVVDGDLYSIGLYAEVGVFFTPTPDLSAYASADPMIAVDPSFPDAGAYSIVLSPGVANSVEMLPEPGSLWLLTAGALAVTLGQRRQRR